MQIAVSNFCTKQPFGVSGREGGWWWHSRSYKGFLDTQIWWLKLHIDSSSSGNPQTGAQAYSFGVRVTCLDLSLLQYKFSPEQGGQDPGASCSGLGVIADSKPGSSCSGNKEFSAFSLKHYSRSNFFACFTSLVVKLTSSECRVSEYSLASWQLYQAILVLATCLQHVVPPVLQVILEQ